MGQTSGEYQRSTQRAVQTVQGKWRMQILCAMRTGPVRLGSLGRTFPNASKKVLTQNLRELESAGLVVRRDFGGAVRRVEYDYADERRSSIQSFLDQLAHFGASLNAPLSPMSHSEGDNGCAH